MVEKYLIQIEYLSTLLEIISDPIYTQYINTIQEHPGAFILHYNYRVGNSKILEM